MIDAIENAFVRAVDDIEVSAGCGGACVKLPPVSIDYRYVSTGYPLYTFLINLPESNTVRVNVNDDGHFFASISFIE